MSLQSRTSGPKHGLGRDQRGQQGGEQITGRRPALELERRYTQVTAHVIDQAEARAGEAWRQRGLAIRQVELMEHVDELRHVRSEAMQLALQGRGRGRDIWTPFG